jgi:hypothetical protein
MAHMSRQRSYSDDDLRQAVEAARSWRDVLRRLELKATSSSAMRSVRTHADRLGLDYGHFTGQRRWRDGDLADAIEHSHAWFEVAERLGLKGGSSHATLKGHALRLGIDTEHLQGPPPRTLPLGHMDGLTAQLGHLPRAGNLLAASWFSLCGYDVSWPLEPAVYDLLVAWGDGFARIQVKTTAMRAGDGWMVRLTRSGTSRTYDPDDVDFFFVIDGDLAYYLIPVGAVGGLQGIHLAAYADYRLDRTVN